jgi:site-specific recombinase XerC
LQKKRSTVGLSFLSEAKTYSFDCTTLVLYCARHDYGTRVLMRTGNLAAVMRTMGHRDVKTAMHYQHPELEIVRAALDYRPPSGESAV